MSRRRFESALVASAMIESGLSPCFRISRVRFVRHCYPPGYKTTSLPSTEDSFKKQHTDESLTLTATCTCFSAPVISEDSETRKNISAVNTILGEGDCEQPESLGTTPCKVHMHDYLRHHPSRGLQDDYSVHSVQFTADGKQLLAGSANTSIRAIRTADGHQRLLPRPSKWILGMPITCIRFMPPCFTWTVACNSHGEVFAFQPDQEGFETLFKEPTQTYALDFSPDGCELATGGVDKKIRIYTLQPGSVIGLPHVIRDRYADTDNVDNKQKSRMNYMRQLQEEQVSVTKPQNVRLHFPGGRPNQIVDTTAKPYVLTRCYGIRDAVDTKNLIEPIAYASEAQSVDPLREYVPTSPGLNVTEGHSKRIMAIRYHPQKPSLLFSAGWDNMVKVWDTRIEAGPVCNIYGPHVASPDGLDLEDNYLLTASWRSKFSLEIWDMRVVTTASGKSRSSITSNPPTETTVPDDAGLKARNSSTEGGLDKPAEVIPISGHIWGDQPWKSNGEYLYAARLLPSGAIVAAGSGFQEVRVVGRDTALPIARIPTDSVVQSLDTILDGRYIAAGCSSGTITLISLA